VISNLSGLVLLLPYIEQNALYAQWDQTTCMSYAYATYGSASETFLGGAPSAANIALAQTPVKTYACPSEISGNMTYAGPNYGVTATQGGIKTNYDFVVFYLCGVYSNIWNYAKNNNIVSWMYIYGENSATKMTDIIDGTSNTLALGEMTYAVYNGNGNGWAFRGWVTGGMDPGTYGINVWNYYTYYTPGIEGQAGSWYYASSLHSGGANFAAADGSVHFISQATPTSVLAELCTYRGGEVIGDMPY
jgi:prepilin-type processing-associated H-X9-DG protein